MPMAAPGNGNYSCRTATETLEWIHSIIRFIHPYRFLIDAHVVNFFKDRLWESVDKEWLDSLRSEPVENLLQIPSGAVQDHWPASLKDFVVMLRSLALPREQADLKKVLPDICITPLNKVISQGMNQKKKHEIEVLSAVVSSIARSVRTNTTIDVGAGQGYLAQVLSFHYQLSVIAIDACSHHGRITDARAERIKKHYEAMMRKSRLENRELSMPTTVTCHVLSTDTLKMLSNSLILKEDSSCLLLAGLHACGDLSVTMLRTFLECEEVKAVVSIGCCYNLLSEDDGDENAGCGFPMSGGVKSAGFSLGKSSRDLACQSAERWRGLGEDAGLHNFELHAFRAAFQMVLCRHYPEILMRSSPTIGRQGKALRRQQNRAMRESSLLLQPQKEESLATMKKHAQTEPYAIISHGADSCCNDTATIITEKITSTYVNNKLSNFEKFSKSGLCRLGLTQHSQDIIDLAGIWKESEPFAELIGPYWTLRAALGPVLETLILLDRLLFLQEQGNDSVEALLLPIFDPTLSPRNMALIAKKI